MSIKKANAEMLYIVKILLEELDVEKAARIAAFYDFSKDELEFLVGERAEEIADFVEEHGLHRIEDESFLTGFESKIADLTESKEEDLESSEKSEEDKIKDEKKSRKKGKDLTLDTFFS